MLYWCLRAAVCQGQGSKTSVYPSRCTRSAVWTLGHALSCHCPRASAKTGFASSSLPNASPSIFGFHKQPSKHLTIHVWFPGCTYSLSGEEGLEGWDMISLRLRLALYRCPRPSWGPEPLTCGSARLSPPRLSSPVGIHVFWHLSKGRLFYTGSLLFCIILGTKSGMLFMLMCVLLSGGLST